MEKSELTVLITILQEISEFSDTSSCQRIPLRPMQHASDDACMHTFVQQRDSWSGGDNIGYRRLELLDQPRLVRCERAELSKVLLLSVYGMQVSKFECTYELDELDEHPVVSRGGEELE